MNLLIVGWGLTAEARTRAKAAMRSMTEAFPLLDVATVGSFEAGRAFAAWMHWPAHALGPRRYVHQGPGGLTLFDGVAADASGRVTGHEAASLATHWNELGELLEGSYLAVRILPSTATLEIVNDPFGMHPAFVHRDGGAWWLSNSVSLLARAVGLSALDVDGMASFLVRHQPGGDRTLVRGIEALPPAQHWCWSGDGDLQRATYAPLMDLARVPRRSFGADAASELAAAMGGTLRALSVAHAPLMCPITSGRDSRMIVGLMMSEGLPGDYFTAGDPASADVLHGAAIARRFGLPHRLTGGDHGSLMARWDEVSRRSVLQTDGFVTLAHARNAASAPHRLDRVGVQLYGAGGELARAGGQRESFALGRPTVEDAVAEVLRKADRGGLLVRGSVREEVRREVEHRLHELRDVGFEAVDLPVALAAIESNRRWSAAQARQIAGHKGVFMPLYCRAYVRAAFASSPVERLMERVPYALLDHLSPELRRMPTQVPWPPQWRSGMLAQRAYARQLARAESLLRRFLRRMQVAPGRRRDRRQLLDDVLPRWRERFLDRADSSLWGLVDRDAFESLTAPSAPPRQRSLHGPVLLQVGTAFTYEEALRGWVDWQPPSADAGLAAVDTDVTSA